MPAAMVAQMLLLLSGGAPAAAFGPPYTTQYLDWYEWDPWADPGEGGKYKNCRVTGPHGATDQYCVEHDPQAAAPASQAGKNGMWRHCFTGADQDAEDKAKKWMKDNC